jgi:hypothetical protein
MPLVERGVARAQQLTASAMGVVSKAEFILARTYSVAAPLRDGCHAGA